MIAPTCKAQTKGTRAFYNANPQSIYRRVFAYRTTNRIFRIELTTSSILNVCNVLAVRVCDSLINLFNYVVFGKMNLCVSTFWIFSLDAILERRDSVPNASTHFPYITIFNLFKSFKSSYCYTVVNFKICVLGAKIRFHLSRLVLLEFRNVLLCIKCSPISIHFHLKNVHQWFTHILTLFHFIRPTTLHRTPLRPPIHSNMTPSSSIFCIPCVAFGRSCISRASHSFCLILTSILFPFVCLVDSFKKNNICKAHI